MPLTSFQLLLVVSVTKIL